MAYVPRGVLETIRKKCLKIMWIGKREKDGIPIVEWKSLAKPKNIGGWGFKKFSILARPWLPKVYGG